MSSQKTTKKALKVALMRYARFKQTPFTVVEMVLVRVASLPP